MTDDQMKAARAFCDAMAEEPNDEHECIACGTTYHLRDGCHATALCDGCVQDSADLLPEAMDYIDSLRTQLTALRLQIVDLIDVVDDETQPAVIVAHRLLAAGEGK